MISTIKLMCSGFKDSPKGLIKRIDFIIGWVKPAFFVAILLTN